MVLVNTISLVLQVRYLLAILLLKASAIKEAGILPTKAPSSIDEVMKPM